MFAVNIKQYSLESEDKYFIKLGNLKLYTIHRF